MRSFTDIPPFLPFQGLRAPEPQQNARSPRTDPSPISPPPRRSSSGSVTPRETTPSEPPVFKGLTMPPPLDLWQQKLERPLSHIREAVCLVKLAALPVPEHTYAMYTLGPNLSVCQAEAERSSNKGVAQQLARQAEGLKALPSRLQALDIAMRKHPDHGPDMARALLKWTLAELLDCLAAPVLSADLLLLGLREGLSAAEIIRLHRGGLTIGDVHRVRTAYQSNGRPTPSLSDIALYGQARDHGIDFVDWGTGLGFKPDELSALEKAGWNPDATPPPPAPDATARNLCHLQPRKKPSPDGWVELQDPWQRSTVTRYRFKACRCGSPEAQALRRGLFMQGLAGLLGLGHRMLPLRAHVQTIDGQPVYGVLMGPLPPDTRMPRFGRWTETPWARQQAVEQSWLEWLGHVRWPDTGQFRQDTDQGTNVLLGLPSQVDDSIDQDDQPVQFVNFNQPGTPPDTLKSRLRSLTLNALEPLLSGLPLLEQEGFRQRWNNWDLADPVDLEARPPQRGITRLDTTGTAFALSPRAPRPRTWMERLERLKPEPQSPLGLAAQRLDTLEKTPVEPAWASRALHWGQLQRARAGLARELEGWSADHLRRENRSAARRQRQALQLWLRHVEAPSRLVAETTMEREWPASVEAESRQLLASNLKSYEHWLIGPLENVKTLQTVLEWNLKLVTQLDKLAKRALDASPNAALPAWLTQARQTIKADQHRLVKAKALAQQIEAMTPGELQRRNGTPAELMALADVMDWAEPGWHLAWKAGATPSDLIHLNATMPPKHQHTAWLLLARQLLQQQARTLQLKDPSSLQAVYPLSEIALMARAAMTAAPVQSDPTTPYRPPADGLASQVRAFIARHRPDGGSMDSSGPDAPRAAVEMAASDLDQALRSLHGLSVSDQSIPTVTAAALKALTALDTALLALYDHTSTPDGVKAYIHDTLQDVSHREREALLQLPAMAAALPADDPIPLPLLMCLLSGQDPSAHLPDSLAVLQQQLVPG